MTPEERAVLERAIDRMGWPEINAFREELRRGQDIYEDAGGFWMRAIRRLFGLPSPYSVVVSHQDAARALVKRAAARPRHRNPQSDPNPRPPVSRAEPEQYRRNVPDEG